MCILYVVFSFRLFQIVCFCFIFYIYIIFECVYVLCVYNCQLWWNILIVKLYTIIGRLKYLTLTEANRVWMPDLFFSNEKEGHFHNIIMPNVYIRIFPNGSVLYSIRISLTLACPMNLKLYPLDRQICSLRMASCKYELLKFLSILFSVLFLYLSFDLEGFSTLIVRWRNSFPHYFWELLTVFPSFKIISINVFNYFFPLFLSPPPYGIVFEDGWTTNDLVFLWKEGDPVQVVKNLHLPRFTLEKFLTDYCNSKTNTGTFKFVLVHLKKKKKNIRLKINQLDLFET